MKKYIKPTLKWLLVLFFIAPGIMKLSGQAAMIEAFAGFGYSTAFMYFIGACEVLGALGIAFGKRVHPKLPTLAVTGLIIIMAGAIYSHISSGDPYTAVIPAIVNVVLLAIYCKLLSNSPAPETPTTN